MNDRWLSTKEICIYWCVSHDTVSRWIAKGMPAVKMGKCWKFKQLLVDEWIIANVAKHKQASKG